MSRIIIDGKEIDVPAEYTLLQACEAVGAEMPRFCYHERLSIAGNCRMCLVEVKGGPPKPTVSCAMGVKDLRPGPNGEPPVVLTKSQWRKRPVKESWNSCSSITRSTARFAIRVASAICRTKPWPLASIPRAISRTSVP